MPLMVKAQQWEWIHRNFRLDYWIDPVGIKTDGDNKFVDVQAEGVCSFSGPPPDVKLIKRWIRTEEISCGNGLSRSRSIKLFDASGQLISSQDLNETFRSPSTFGIAKIINRVCGITASTDGILDDTQVQNFPKFSNECVKFADKRVGVPPNSKLVAEGYVDLSRIYAEGGVAYAWTRSVSESKQTTKSGKDYYRYETKHAFRCNTREYSNVEEYKFDLNGNSVDFFKIPSIYSANWQSVRPGSGIDKAYELVCGRAASLLGQAKPGIAASPAPAPKSGISVSGTGSGFKISANHFITNNHVTEGCLKVAIQGNEATVVSADKRSDLALLRSIGTIGSVAQLRQQRVRVGDEVSVAGFPLSGILSGFNFTRGNVSGLSGLGGDTRLLQISAPIQPGNSGGPLMDSAGNIIGVVVSKLSWKALSITGDIPQNVNFAINSNSLISFLDANGVDYQTASTAKSVSAADVAEKAKGFTVLVECYQ